MNYEKELNKKEDDKKLLNRQIEFIKNKLFNQTLAIDSNTYNKNIDEFNDKVINILM